MFRGLPPNYYPNTPTNIIKIAILLLLSWIMYGAVFYGCLTWLQRDAVTATYWYIGIYVVGIIIMLILIAVGGKIRLKQELLIIEEKLKKEGL